MNLQYVPLLIDNLQKDMPPTTEILSDNFDLIRSPTLGAEQNVNDKAGTQLVSLNWYRYQAENFQNSSPKSVSNHNSLPWLPATDS